MLFFVIQKYKHMKLTGILLLMIISLNAFAFETDFTAKTDTNERYNIAKSKYKLSRYEFLDLYGDNDTIAEIIKLYYRKRNIVFINPEFLATLSVLGVAISYDHYTCSGTEKGYWPIRTMCSIPFVFASALYCSVRAPINLSTYSRINLYLEIENYLKTGKMKPGTLRKISRRLE